MEVKGLVISAVPGKHIREVINQPDLLDMVLLPNDEGLTQRELRLDGRVYHASISPVLSEGRSLGKICILRDITQYKELDELKSDFVATVSHDLRSPLTLVRGYATMLQMVGDLNEQQKGYVRKIISGVENMTRLVNNLLDLGRIDAGIGLQIGPVRIFEVIERVVNQLQPQASQKKIHLMQDSGADRSLLENVTIQADAALLEQALYNLLDNAIKFTNVGGKVDIEVQLRPKMIVFEVRDTGIGVAPLDQPHMFEKFYRSGRREAYQQRGTGLGLAIVKTIAERHGGRVWVESVLGKGSSFYLEVPFKQARGERLK
jgi:signal transduction histidine kinase